MNRFVGGAGSSSLSSENNGERDLMMSRAESRRSRNRRSRSACGSAGVRTGLLRPMSLLLLPMPSKGVIVGELSLELGDADLKG